MNLILSPAHLRGSITPPPSKSNSHRLLIAAALASGESIIENFLPGEDLTATVRTLRALGADIHSQGSTLHISGIASRSVRTDDLPHLDCGESGSTLRFLIPVALAVAGGGVFHGSKRLFERPLGPYFDIFQKQGVEYSLTDDALTICGKLLPGEYLLPGNVSSQFFSGLFFALPLLGAPSRIIPDGHMESFSYVGMTLHTLSQFGIHIPATLSIPPQYHVPSDTYYLPGHFRAENDWSQAAFWYAAAGIGNAVTVAGMDDDSLQGDRVILDHGAQIKNGGCISIDISDCPDLAPPLAVWGALMNGELHLTNAARLRMKESDRLASITRALAALGADIHEGADSLTIRGKDRLRGGAVVNCENDHRIAMMLAIAATRCEQPITLLGAQCVNKSYPHFWQDYASLGGIIHEHAGQ